ncbi:MAG: hypothetical protein IJQ07_04395 [Clostridia bacterium]|nr:hypothetical protein [Clostridia bacterium]
MNGFDRVSYKTHVFKRDFTDEIKTVNQLTLTRTSIATAGTSPVKFYHCNGDTYGYSTDKKIRKIVGSEYVFQNFTSNVVPLILPVIVNGEKKVMFVSDETAKIDEETVSGVPYGSSGVFFAGRLFIADGNKLKYSAEFDFVNFSVGLDIGGFIELDKDAGEILYLSKNGDDLYVIAEHAIFSLSPYGKPYEFKLERIPTFGLSIVKNSVFGENGVIGFLNGKDFCMLSYGKVKFVSNTMNAAGTFTMGVADGYNGLYVLPFTVNRVNYVFAYDFGLKKEVVEQLTGCSVSGEYVAKNTDIRFYRTSISTATVAVSATYNGEYDFGSCAKKSVCKIEAHITGSAEIVVSGEGVFRAALTEKCNRTSCYVHGRIFNIGFENASENFKINKLVIYYVIHGE